MWSQPSNIINNYWLNNRIDVTFSIKNVRGVEILPLHDVRLSNFNSYQLEVLFTDDDFDQNSLLDVDGTATGHLTKYKLTDEVDYTWIIYGLLLTDIDWCEITKPYITVLPLATFSFKSRR